MRRNQKLLAAALFILGAGSAGCLFVPLPGVDGEGCSVQPNDAGISVITCPDGSTAPLFAARGDARPSDSDAEASLDAGPGRADGGSFECADREALDAGAFDPCGRAHADNPRGNDDDGGRADAGMVDAGDG